ncbi:MAG: 30S ribosomal protein S6 [Candidatus Pacebacteria bacterium]|nr:30S ribosomal protein S6 [Candidatus Paceibacterota bacterium]MDD4074145.1 30S ribosomal protein S6 [Candidatus Paceibacterota bacterium]
MMFYEINLLLSPNLEEAEASSFVENLEKELQIHGKVESVTKPERKKLAYEISDQTEAWLYFFNLYPEEEKDKKEILDAIEKSLKESKDVLRHLFIRKEPKKKKERRTRAPKGLETTPKVKDNIEKIDEKLEEMLGE